MGYPLLVIYALSLLSVVWGSWMLRPLRLSPLVEVRLKGRYAVYIACLRYGTVAAFGTCALAFVVAIVDVQNALVYVLLGLCGLVIALLATTSSIVLQARSDLARHMAAAQAEFDGRTVTPEVLVELVCYHLGQQGRPVQAQVEHFGQQPTIVVEGKRFSMETEADIYSAMFLLVARGDLGVRSPVPMTVTLENRPHLRPRARLEMGAPYYRY